MELAVLRDRISYQGALLAGFTLLTGAALMTANHLTLPAIERAATEDMKASLVQVLPQGMADNVEIKTSSGSPRPPSPQRMRPAAASASRISRASRWCWNGRTPNARSCRNIIPAETCRSFRQKPAKAAPCG